MKNLTALLITILISQISLGQDDYEKYIQAILKGDAVLAAQIERNYAYENKIEPIKEYPFPIKNIPEHVFKLNINALKDTLLTFFKMENGPQENKFLREVFYFYYDTTEFAVYFSAESNKDTILSDEYFSQPNTSNDIYLHAYRATWISNFYYSDGRPIKYTADFVFKLTKIDENSTDVKVVAISPEIVSGMGLGVHGPMNIYTKAHPTTIEEYSLLLFVADNLDDTSLLPLKLPSSQ
jgi:hypothetical protein